MTNHLTRELALTDTWPITHVRVVVHTMGAAGPNTSDNHWSIYLIHPPTAEHEFRSTRVNMRADYGDRDGILDWRRHNYIYTTSTIAYWDFPAAAGLTVSHIAQNIYNLGRERYVMSGGGSGCRWWVYTVIGDMGQRNYIHPSAHTQLWPNLLFLYHKEKDRRQLNMVRGEFC